MAGSSGLQRRHFDAADGDCRRHVAGGDGKRHPGGLSSAQGWHDSGSFQRSKNRGGVVGKRFSAGSVVAALMLALAGAAAADEPGGPSGASGASGATGASGASGVAKGGTHEGASSF